jgi:hypothetical protein
MNPKNDGRLYSRVLRHGVYLCQYIGEGRNVSIREIAQELHDNNSPEFYIQRLGRTISVHRIEDYLRYLAAIEALSRTGDRYSLAFPLKSTDREWAIKFSDLAWSYMASKKRISNQEFQKSLRETISDLSRKNSLPMLVDIIDAIKTEGSGNEEYLRWSLYLYTDGENCPFDIRHFPVLITKR